MVFRIFGCCHCKVVFSLVGLASIRRVVTDMISCVHRVLLDFNVRSIELSSDNFTSLENVSGSSTWNLVFHEGVFRFNIGFDLLVTPDVYVFNSILLQELVKRSKRIDTRVSNSACLESLRSLQIMSMRGCNRNTYLLTVGCYDFD